jgi:hypothetical protein
MKKPKEKERSKSGPKAQRLKLRGDWQALVGKALAKKTPQERLAEAVTRVALRGVFRGLVVGVAVVLAACAAQPKWTHPTKSEQDMHSDSYECQKERAAAGLKGVYGTRFFNSCMRARGWRE